jgi:hypothetical protein
MEFEEAVGFIIGDEGGGMRAMFTMMNNARLSVGLEGLALAEPAYQQALAYARERRQGRSLTATSPGPSPIVEHPDVQLMLATMKAGIDAMRGLLYLDASLVDASVRHPDPEQRREAADLVALLTPVCKAWSTDLGVTLTSLAVQVHGGMGYVEETGIAQLWRDSRIAPIYEGTNGIQAIDLVTRKLSLDGGKVVARLLDRVEDEAGATPALAALRRATEAMAAALAEGRLADALAGASPYLTMLGTVLGDWMLQRQANAARALLDGGAGDAVALGRRIASAGVYRSRILPTACGLEASATAGVEDLLAMGFTTTP